MKDSIALNLEADGDGYCQRPSGNHRDYRRILHLSIGIILVLLTLFIVLNLVQVQRWTCDPWLSATTVIAAESVGLNITKYKLMAFSVSAALAGRGRRPVCSQPVYIEWPLLRTLDTTCPS